MKFALKLHKDVEKQLVRIPKKQRDKLVSAMRSLCEEPRPSGCVKLEDILYRIREGEYRIIYAILEEEVVVLICKVTRRTESTYRDIRILLNKAIRQSSKY